MPISTQRPEMALFESHVPKGKHRRGAVLLLHGHGRTGASMLLMAYALHRAGYDTMAPSYGIRRSMDAILRYLEPDVRRFAAARPGPFHILTHSLGGLVARALITQQRPADLGRVVMLAPPNAGSEIADLLCRYNLETAVLGPVGSQLRTSRPLNDERLLGCIDFELGVIAGNKPIAPVLPTLLPQPNDGLVSVAATRITGMTDHIVLPVDHSRMMHDKRVIAQSLGFLETGAFRHAGHS